MDRARFRHPEAIVTPEELAARLDDPALRVFDCTTHLLAATADAPYRVESGRADFESGHIPGAGHLDLEAEFSVAGAPYRFTLPPVEQLVRAFERHGVGDGTRVVLYSRGALSWATRFWWMLRALGFDDAAVLDGGWRGWVESGGAVSTDPCRYPPGRMTPAPRPGLFVGRAAVLAAIGDEEVCTINALSAEHHRGDSARYGRPGRVPGSVNAPAADMVAPETQRLRPAEEIAAAFAGIGADRAKRVIAYCGGGIAATVDAFLLHQLGHDDVAVYDASMSEWATDETLPIETG